MNPSPPVVETIAECRRLIAGARAEGKSIGFVPTMGALHDGHVRLMEECRSRCGFLVASIFVNPTQFGPTEDYAKYPRTPEEDHSRCSSAGVDLIFEPTVAEMYPRGPVATFVEVPGLSSVLEGRSRPTHFRGVTTVVAKLFHIVQPDRAAFGLKDYQQLAVIRRMVDDLDFPVELLPVETVREPDGLAMSSRNRYLSAEQRRAATVLSRALNRAAEAVAAGERSADRVRQDLARTIESEALARLDYAEVADAQSLEPLAELSPGRGAVALVAARIGPARLIDNRLLPT
ncbi:pantoate--beta-alanine ligase [Tautonia sociabilis]|uniref:Pantothenate synthetase n=1 Tax=Tautonia sociabilis TaxID=2080755 RepID=A0A432MQ26_9BACT|nr:pantoate--beta-alanine ligase [Tautonia sociabilis]RUL89176.1 pantoate--beta-alanine ligase [Tautonia sociabilis]